jgi:hypothetical protein
MTLVDSRASRSMTASSGVSIQISPMSQSPKSAMVVAERSSKRIQSRMPNLPDGAITVVGRGFSRDITPAHRGPLARAVRLTISGGNE